MKKGTCLIATVITLLLVVGTVYGVLGTIDKAYVYELHVGSHIDMISRSTTPEMMLEEIDLIVEGMHDLGLEPNMTARWFSWEQTPNRQVAFAYAWLEGFKERVQAVIDWREATYADNTTTEFADVYQEKVSNLRAEIARLDCPTWIILDAYYLNNEPVYYWRALWLVPLVASMAFMVVLTICIGLYMMAEKRRKTERRREEERKRRKDEEWARRSGDYATCEGDYPGHCGERINLPPGDNRGKVAMCPKCGKRIALTEYIICKGL